MKKRGDILIENVVFIILNVMFISILMLFLWKQGTGAVLVEETNAKSIALLIDSAQPLMKVQLNMETAKGISDENEFDFANVVRVTGNVVSVQLSEKGGYQYSFFNDVSVEAYPETKEGEYTGVYIFTVNEQ